MNSEQNPRGVAAYMLETVAGVVLFYFLLGGSSAHPAVWAAFTVVAVWIVLMNLRRDVGLETEASFDRWKLAMGFVLVAIVLAAGVWKRSWWLVGLGLLLVIIWRGDLRAHRRLYRKLHQGKAAR